MCFGCGDVLAGGVSRVVRFEGGGAMWRGFGRWHWIVGRGNFGRGGFPVFREVWGLACLWGWQWLWKFEFLRKAAFAQSQGDLLCAVPRGFHAVLAAPCAVEMLVGGGECYMQFFSKVCCAYAVVACFSRKGNVCSDFCRYGIYKAYCADVVGKEAGKAYG